MKLGVSVHIGTFLALLDKGGLKNGQNIKKVVFLRVLNIHQKRMKQR